LVVEQVELVVHQMLDLQLGDLVEEPMEEWLVVQLLVLLVLLGKASEVVVKMVTEMMVVEAVVVLVNNQLQLEEMGALVEMEFQVL
jgi:hypothetical protein